MSADIKITLLEGFRPGEITRMAYIRSGIL